MAKNNQKYPYDMRNRQAYEYLKSIRRALQEESGFFTRGKDDAERITDKNLKAIYTVLSRINLNTDWEGKDLVNINVRAQNYKKDYQELHKLLYKIRDDVLINEQEDFYLTLIKQVFEQDRNLTDVIYNDFNKYKESKQQKYKDVRGLDIEKEHIKQQYLNENRLLRKYVGKRTTDILFGSKGRKSFFRLLFSNHPESPISRASTVFGSNFAPQESSNIPYLYGKVNVADKDIKCLRIGTQVRQVNGVNSIYPSFKKYIDALPENGDKPAYVYINKLKHNYPEENDKSLSKPKWYEFGKLFARKEIKAERDRTIALHALEEDSNRKAVVITTPADNSQFFFKGFDISLKDKDLHNPKEYTQDSIVTQIADSIINNTNDFKFSDKAKREIFTPNNDSPSKDDLKRKITQEVRNMVQKSTAKFVSDGVEKFDSYVRQAIVMDVVNVQLTDLILKTYQPEAYNVSCKDAIDRAGIANLVYHFNKRLEQGNPNPMTENEFNKLVNGPALLVKSRPLNKHMNVLWNYMDEYSKNNTGKKKPDWLDNWLEVNDPRKKSAPTPRWYNNAFNAVKNFFGVGDARPEVKISPGTQRVSPVINEAESFLEGSVSHNEFAARFREQGMTRDADLTMHAHEQHERSSKHIELSETKSADNKDDQQPVDRPRGPAPTR